MKNSIYKSVWFFLLAPIYLMANIACLSPYKCKTNGETLDGKFYPSSLENCRLPKMDTLSITPIDVFKEDGTLKTYFGTGKTLCDVLGWMNDGAEKLKDVDGLIKNYTEPITLEFKSC